MNYRHAFHAGNFADVFKHIVLTRILQHLVLKESAFRVIDTHAGAGAYDLGGVAANRTGEWVEGVGRMTDQPLEAPAAALIEDWLGPVRQMLAGKPSLYPGSPVLAQLLTRAQDRLVFCEKRPEDAEALRAALGRDRRVLVMAADGWQVLTGQLPPPERRGLVLIDPPFEDEREMRTIVDSLEKALRRWASGTYAVWYPIKGRREIEAFARRLAALPTRRTLRAEISLFDIERVDRLNGCGMAILNPPWRLDEDLASVLPALSHRLAREGQGHWHIEWLRSEAEAT